MVVAEKPGSFAVVGLGLETLCIAAVRKLDQSLWAEAQARWAAAEVAANMTVVRTAVDRGGHCCLHLDTKPNLKTFCSQFNRKNSQRKR